jgi:hypothetical protein
MKDAGLIIRTKIFERLNQTITYNSKSVKCYDYASVSTQAYPPYIIIGNFTSTEIGEGSKQSYGQECFIDIEVITSYSNAFGGRKDSDLIANEVMELIRTRQAGYLDLSPNWTCIGVQLDNTTNLMELNNSDMIIRKIMRFKINIYEQ